jgi:hypothetical protein
VEGPAVDRREDGDSREPGFPDPAEESNGNFAAIGDQDFLHHGLFDFSRPLFCYIEGRDAGTDYDRIIEAAGRPHDPPAADSAGIDR